MVNDLRSETAGSQFESGFVQRWTLCPANAQVSVKQVEMIERLGKNKLF